LINASGQIGRAIALAITTSVQTAFVAHAKKIPVTQVGSIIAGDPISLKGIRVANWFNFALALCCVVICGVTFRGTGIVGKIPTHVPRGVVELGTIQEKDERSMTMASLSSPADSRLDVTVLKKEMLP
jgi:hypothetical protein